MDSGKLKKRIKSVKKGRKKLKRPVKLSEQIIQLADFIEASAAENNTAEILDLLLSPAEISRLNMRIQIIKALIENNETQRDMASRLSLSIAQITRGSNELKHSSEKVVRFLKNHHTSPAK